VYPDCTCRACQQHEERCRAPNALAGAPRRAGRRQGSAVDSPDEAMTRPAKDNAPFSALAFKIMADQFVGSLTFLRIYRRGATA